MEKQKKIKYFNPKTCKYQTSIVLSISGDVVNCLNVKVNYQYQESLERLRHFANEPNPNWHHPTIKKPLVILNF